MIVLSIAAALPETATIGLVHLWDYPPLRWLRSYKEWQLGIVIAALSWVATSFIVPYFGRVVRYTRAKPGITYPAAVIGGERGLALPSELHDKEYVRIIVVGHSLAPLLAYDLINSDIPGQASRCACRGSMARRNLTLSSKSKRPSPIPLWPS